MSFSQSMDKDDRDQYFLRTNSGRVICLGHASNAIEDTKHELHRRRKEPEATAVELDEDDRLVDLGYDTVLDGLLPNPRLAATPTMEDDLCSMHSSAGSFRTAHTHFQSQPASPSIPDYSLPAEMTSPADLKINIPTSPALIPLSITSQSVPPGGSRYPAANPAVNISRPYTQWHLPLFHSPEHSVQGDWIDARPVGPSALVLERAEQPDRSNDITIFGRSISRLAATENGPPMVADLAGALSPLPSPDFAVHFQTRSTASLPRILGRASPNTPMAHMNQSSLDVHEIQPTLSLLPEPSPNAHPEHPRPPHRGSSPIPFIDRSPVHVTHHGHLNTMIDSSEMSRGQALSRFDELAAASYASTRSVQAPAVRSMALLPPTNSAGRRHDLLPNRRTAVPPRQDHLSQARLHIDSPDIGARDGGVITDQIEDSYTSPVLGELGITQDRERGTQWERELVEELRQPVMAEDDEQQQRSKIERHAKDSLTADEHNRDLHSQTGARSIFPLSTLDSTLHLQNGCDPQPHSLLDTLPAVPEPVTALYLAALEPISNAPSLPPMLSPTLVQSAPEEADDQGRIDNTVALVSPTPPVITIQVPSASIPENSSTNFQARQAVFPLDNSVDEVRFPRPHSFIHNAILGRHRELGTIVLKRLPSYRKDEGEIWRTLSHDHLLPFLGKCLVFNVPYLGFPNVAIHPILRFLETDPTASQHRERFLKEIALALTYLHERKIRHGDVCADNILISRDRHALLFNFQSSIRNCTNEDFGADVFDFGATIAEVLKVKKSFFWKPKFRVLRPRRPNLQPQDVFLWDIAEQCWESDLRLCPTISEVYEELDLHSASLMESLSSETSSVSSYRSSRSSHSSLRTPSHSGARQESPSLLGSTQSRSVRRLGESTMASTEMPGPSRPHALNQSLEGSHLRPKKIQKHSRQRSSPVLSNVSGTVSEPLTRTAPAREIPKKSEEIKWETCMSSSKMSGTGRTGVRYRRTGDAPVGIGGFSNVWRGILKRPNGTTQQIAVKELREVRLPDLDPAHVMKTMLKRLKHEIDIWMDLDHPNIVPLLGFTVSNTFCLISPWHKNGQICQYIQVFPKCDKLKLLEEVASGLEYLHTRKPAVVHGDIKSDNVLIDDHGCAALIDFGLSRLEKEVSSSVTSSLRGMGHVRWMAPELLGDAIAKTTSTDVYSFGCLCLQVLTGEVPYRKLDKGTVIAVALATGIKPVTSRHEYSKLEASDPFWGIMEACWEADPGARPPIHFIRETIHALRQSSGPIAI